MRLLSTPIRLTGPLVLSQLTVLVTADGFDDAEWLPSVLAGDLSGQYSAEREMAKEGHDRETLGRAAFIERVRAFEADRRVHAAATFAHLGIDLDLDAAAINHDDVERAARTAFVQLYEAGLLHRSERVVDTCPRCATVVAPVDVLPAELDGERLTIDLGDGLHVATTTPELLPGVVAVCVPADHAAAGTDVAIPLANRTVPVCADAEITEPRLLVPAHDADDLETARRLSLFPVEVLNDLGEVSQRGPLHRLARFAARQAARDLLAADDAIAAAEPATEPASRCRRCGTVVVPRLGPHWFLDMTDLEVAVADELREGALKVEPAFARDELIDRAGVGGTWCLTHQVWAGSPVPVSTCLDCGQLAVAVDPPASCGKCMGELVSDDSVLDARFVGAVWPLTVAGWPTTRPDAETIADTTLLTTPTGLIRWALPMAALGLKLAGTAPFDCISAVDIATQPDDPEPLVLGDLDDLIETHGRDAVRTALLAGQLPA